MSQLSHVKFALTIKATAALSEGQAVGFDGAVAAAGADIAGFAYFDAAAGTDVTVNISGLLTGKAGEALAKGDALEVGAAGALVKQTTGVQVGTAWAAAAAGKFVQVLAK